MHGPSAAAAVAAKAATAAELVTQYNLAQLHAAYNELNRNRVAAAAAAQAMADHRASALQQAAAMTAAAAENSPPRYPLMNMVHLEPFCLHMYNPTILH